MALELLIYLETPLLSAQPENSALGMIFFKLSASSPEPTNLQLTPAFTPAFAKSTTPFSGDKRPTKVKIFAPAGSVHSLFFISIGFEICQNLAELGKYGFKTRLLKSDTYIKSPTPPGSPDLSVITCLRKRHSF
ncbi:hypothetical protein D3C78_1302380 [compost metagenome]